MQLERDASRPYQGDLFTGFAIIDKQTGKIIGRISLGSGFEPGECQVAVIVEMSGFGKGYGREAACLVLALGWLFYKMGYEVGPGATKAPVTQCTTTALFSNKCSISLLSKMGLNFIRELSPEENYSAELRGLYGITGPEAEEMLKKLIEWSKFTWRAPEK